MSTFNFQLFGRFSVQRDAEALKGLDANKEQELLSYLLIYRDRHHPREALASLLWGDTSTSRSKKYLRQALWHMQSALQTNQPMSPQLLLVEHDWVQLNLFTDCSLDVAFFEEAFAATQGVPGKLLDSSDAALLKRVVKLYKGDLLDGWYQDWCLFERERLQNMYLCILDKLMCYCEEHSEYELGRSYGATILRYDRARELTYRQLMNLHYMAGDRTGALRQYERCVSALDELVGVKPERRTTELYEYIRCGGPAKPESAKNQPGPVGSVSSPHVLKRLKRLQIILEAVQKRIQQDIQAVEQELNHDS
jgi:DNA-binding SARP family transcriptional activator